MKCFRLALVLIVLQLAAFSGFCAGNGGVPSATLHWRCWYDQRVEILCLIDTLAQAKPMDNLSPRLPLVVRELRSNPEAFRNVVLHIPLFSPPFHSDFTAQLARATVCGSRPDCTVDFTMVPPSTTEIDALLRKNIQEDDLDDVAE